MPLGSWLGCGGWSVPRDVRASGLAVFILEMVGGGDAVALCDSAFRLMEVLWVEDLTAEERLERARLLAKEVAAAAALAEGRVDDLLKAFPGHFELVVKLGQPSC